MLLARRLLLLVLWLLPVATLASSADTEAPADEVRDFEYIAMSPPFVVNVGGTGRIGFLKIEVSLRANKQAASLVQHHMPALRHELIMLFSRQDPDALDSPEQREALRLEALGAVRHAAGSDGVQDLLFTSFIAQR